MTKKQMVIMQGVPGSGKSTIAKSLAAEAWNTGRRAWIVSADDYFVNEETGAYEFDPAKLGEAHAECLRNTIELIRLGSGLIVVDNTNATAVEIAPYYALADAFGYECKILRVETEVDRAADRNVHGVPRHKVRAMDARMNVEVLPYRWKLERIKGE